MTHHLFGPASFLSLALVSSLLAGCGPGEIFGSNKALLTVHLLARVEDSLPVFTSALLTAHSPTRLATPQRRTLAASTFDLAGAALSTAFEELPAAPDLAVRVYLLDAQGNLVASGVKETLTVQAGTNIVGVDLTRNTQVPRLVSGSNNVKVDDGVLIKGARYGMTTGIADGAPGVSRVALSISGPAYVGGQEMAHIATFDAPNLLSYSWRPGQPADQYDPAKLAGTDDKQPFTLTASAIDPFGETVATTRLDLYILGTVTVVIGLPKPGPVIP